MKKSKKKKLVSVVMTLYNEEEFVEKSTRSLKKQTYDNYEIILVDDGSEDRTRDIIKSKIESKKVKMFSIKNSGRPSALNYGIRKSNGEFIAVADADDICFPNRIERQVDYLLAHEGVGVVGSYYHRKDGLRGEEYVRKYPTSDGSIRREMAKYIPISHSCAMYRKRAVTEVGGYDERLADHEDLDLWIRVAQNWKLANIPEPLVVRHIRSDSYWHRNFDAHARNVHLAQLNAKAVRDLSLPFYYYVYPVARLVYPWLPDSVKRIVRRLGSGIEEQDLEDVPSIPSS